MQHSNAVTYAALAAASSTSNFDEMDNESHDCEDENTGSKQGRTRMALHFFSKSYFSLEGSSEMLSLLGTLEIQRPVPNWRALDQMQWAMQLWSHSFDDPFLVTLSAPDKANTKERKCK